MKWFLLIVQVILGMFLVFFAYKQMNQDHFKHMVWSFILYCLQFLWLGILNIIIKVKSSEAQRQ
ncbi:hypothetical protein JKQ03_04035 [Staphylococcus sp. S36]|nr:hypothetical protein [Staphylococcus sp. S36]